MFAGQSEASDYREIVQCGHAPGGEAAIAPRSGIVSKADMEKLPDTSLTIMYVTDYN